MTIYTNRDQVKQTLAQITAQQTRNNLFVNVSVKPYRGKKHDQAKTVSIKIG